MEQLAVEMALGQEQPVVPSVLYQPSARLHQAALQARQRPALDPPWHPQSPPQVAQVVGQHHVEGQPPSGAHVEAPLQVLGHGGDPIGHVRRKEPPCHDDQGDGRHPLVGGHRQAEVDPLACLPNQLLRRDVGGDEADADEPPGKVTPGQEVVVGRVLALDEFLGDTFEVELTCLIPAISQEPGFEGLEDLREGRDWVKTDENYKTKIDGIYGGGDVLNLGLVTIAIYQGRIAAYKIHEEITGEKIEGIQAARGDRELELPGPGRPCGNTGWP